MIKLLLIAVSFFYCLPTFAQQYINMNRAEVKHALLYFSHDRKFNTITAETDSTLSFLIRDTTTQNFDMLVQFDSSGKCDMELKLLNCDRCYKLSLNSVLSNKKYLWTKIDSTHYVSVFSKHLTLTILPNTPFAFVIQRINISRKEYRSRYRKI